MFFQIKLISSLKYTSKAYLQLVLKRMSLQMGVLYLALEWSECIQAFPLKATDSTGFRSTVKRGRCSPRQQVRANFRNRKPLTIAIAHFFLNFVC